MLKAKTDAQRAVLCYLNNGFTQVWDLAISLLGKNRKLHRRAQFAESSAQSWKRLYDEMREQRDKADADVTFWKNLYGNLVLENRMKSYPKRVLDAILGRE